MEEDDFWTQLSSEHQENVSLYQKELGNLSKMADEGIATERAIILDHRESPIHQCHLATGIGRSGSEFAASAHGNHTDDGHSDGTSNLQGSGGSQKSTGSIDRRSKDKSTEGEEEREEGELEGEPENAGTIDPSSGLRKPYRIIGHYYLRCRNCHVLLMAENRVKGKSHLTTWPTPIPHVMAVPRR